MPQFRWVFMIQQSERDWEKTASMGEFQGKSHCWLKRTQRLVSHLAKNILIIPKILDKYSVNWCTRSLTFLKVRVPLHLMKNQHSISSKEHHTNSQTWWWWSGVLCIFRSWTTCHTLMEPWILPSIRKSWRRMSGHQFADLKLKNTWVMQEYNDPKHTSNSTFEWIKKN